MLSRKNENCSGMFGRYVLVRGDPLLWSYNVPTSTLADRCVLVQGGSLYEWAEQEKWRTAIMEQCKLALN
eukprot:m.130491 g.130491  ORF g.130491 m.130491 type:complete len:70 (-) comp13900_c0_seq8:268-477(-)